MSDAWQVATALVAAPSLQEQLRLLLEAAPRVGGAETATIFLRDDLHAAPRAIARHGYQLSAPSAPRASGFTAHVLNTGETVVVDDTTADPRVNPVVLAAGIRSFVALPLLMRRVPGAPPAVPSADHADDRNDSAVASSAPEGSGVPRPMGVLYVNARRAQGFDARTVQALKGLAALAAVAIENNALLEAQRDAADQLREALRLREQFASAASHELKTPLTPLKGYAQSIRRRFERAEAGGEPVDPTWLRRALTVMVDQIDRMDTLVTDLLDASRLRAGTFALAPEPLDLVRFARTTFERFREALETSAEQIEPEASHTLTFRAGARNLLGEWDPHRLDQLLTNLLNNAVKYSPDGGEVTLHVSRVGRGAALASVRQHAPQAAPGWALLTVTDQGIGLPPSGPSQETIFQPFSRGSNAPSGRFSGFGLGLYICAEVARRHGGAIWAESSGPMQGTSFSVTFPPQAPETPESAGVPEPSPPAGGEAT